MRFSRRSWLKKAMAVAAARSVAGAPAQAGADLQGQALGLVVHSYMVRQADARRKFTDVVAFLEHARTVGAAGAQIGIGRRDDAGVEAVRQWLGHNGLYLEGMVGLPRDRNDLEPFTAEVRTARDCGVTILRTVMLNGRRYETFDSAAAFRRFADESFGRLMLARPVAERFGVKLAIENHKDWRAPELVEILKRANSPQFGVCVDTGNSMALLEEPHEVVEELAPFAFSTHLKDMAVRPYEDGFLLSEVPLGTGLLDLPRIVRTLRTEQPGIRLNLEMITRDALKVPCLTEKYWATLESLPARHLARMLKLVQQRAWPEPLPVISGQTKDQQLQTEEDNIRRCLEFARTRLSE